MPDDVLGTMQDVETIIRQTEITEESIGWVRPLAGKLRAFYVAVGHQMTDRELFWEIERRFGNDMYKSVCVASGMNNLECVALALKALKTGKLN